MKYPECSTSENVQPVGGDRGREYAHGGRLILSASQKSVEAGVKERQEWHNCRPSGINGGRAARSRHPHLGWELVILDKENLLLSLLSIYAMTSYFLNIITVLSTIEGFISGTKVRNKFNS